MLAAAKKGVRRPPTTRPVLQTNTEATEHLKIDTMTLHKDTTMGAETLRPTANEMPRVLSASSADGQDACTMDFGR